MPTAAHSYRRTAPAAVFLAALVLAPLLAPIAARAAHASGPEAVALVSGAGQLRVASGDGGRAELELELELDLEPGVRFRAVEALDDGWIAAGVRDGRTLLLIRSHAAAGRAERTVAPAPGGALVADPVPLVRDGRLEGLAWLAGDGPRTLGARYAGWLGDAWGPTETVSDPGPGSQLALAGAALPGDEILLLWSAFDGSDDEIVHARRSGGSWSEPARIAADNGVPDVTPALAVVRGRPVAAWSRYDGRDYRVVLSHRDGDAWSAPEPYGPAGSLFPRFETGGTSGGALLVFREAVSGAWTALRLDGALRPTARATIEAPADGAPAVLGFDAEGLRVVADGDRTPREIPWRPIALEVRSLQKPGS